MSFPDTFSKSFLINLFFSLFVSFFTLPYGYSFSQSKITDDRPSGKMIARIGSKEITVENFLYRSEFTIRPARFKDKNTTLNNLISEKILAIEAEQRKTDLLQNPLFLGNLKGIKEQLMREKLYELEAADKVVLDSNEVFQKYKRSAREYEVEFYVLGNDSVSFDIAESLKKNAGSADSIFKSLEKKVGKKPLKEVKYLDPDDENITEALYSTSLDTGAVLGPIKLLNGDHILMRVNNWKDEILFSGEDQRTRWNKVAEKIHLAKSLKLWSEYLSEVMKGKRIDYNEEVFFKLADHAYQYYLNKNTPPDSLELILNEIPKLDEAVNLKSNFFSIDGNTWTVEDFKEELVSHPLVYRAHFSDQKSFNQQFFIAISDMVRDHYLNKEAYQLSLDTLQDINKTVSLWRDSYLAIDQQKVILNSALQKGIIHNEDNTGKLNYWESYLINLQKRYSDSIKMDYKEFDKIKLTNIDFIAYKPGAPFPSIVPGFPILISSDDLDYIKKKNKIN
ncbi:MAG TPA: hypothetical protein VMT35_03290 [Ignavibacteriaceae bacterium]|nr:hypothetical protein [Ignavibacteriaceae bacterium]